MLKKNKKDYRILYIEDDEEDFYFIQCELESSKRANFKIEWVFNENDIFKKDLDSYDLFIVDYILPTNDGISIMKNINKILKNKKPFIILTGIDERAVDEEALSSGASDFLIKGLMGKEVLERAIIYNIEKNKYLNYIEEKNNLLESVLESIDSYVFLLNSEGKVIICNEKAKNDFEINLEGSLFDSKVEFFAYKEDVFDYEIKEKLKINKYIKENKDNIPENINGIMIINDKKISCKINISVINRGNKIYKVISIIDTSKDFEKKEILRKNNKKLENNLKKYGLEKKNPNPLIDLLDIELDKFIDLEEKNGNY